MNIRFFLSFILLISIFPCLSAQAEMADFPAVKLRTLDKATARTNTLEVKVGETIQFGSLFIKVQSCRKSDPLDKPESAAFLQIWEVPINSDKSEWIFSGWMFASSPALSAMDHPVYDVWVLECTGVGKSKPQPVVQPSEEPNLEEKTSSDTQEAKALPEDSEVQTEESEPVSDNSQSSDKSIESIIDEVVTEDDHYE